MQYLVDVQWENEDYRDLSYPADSVIYCDPPYTGTTQYGAVGAFNSVEFWDWCLKKHDQGYAIFVSEYTAPDTFEAILTIPTRTNIRTKANGREARLEKLFVPKGSKYK
jgi:DNA adenine methylase